MNIQIIKRIRNASLVKWVLLFYLFTFLPLNAQIGTWRAFMSYYEPQQIVKAGSNTLFVRASNSLYSYHLNDHSITTYDKVNTLSDTYISYIAWSQQAKRLIIVYQNGNIDLMDLQENVTNISSLYTKTLTESKTVNNVYIYQQYAYLCMPFGVIKVNMERAEISETYMLNQNIQAVVIDNTSIYARNDQGTVYSALLSTNLIDKSNWNATDTYPAFTIDTADWDAYIDIVKTLKPDGPKYNEFNYLKFQNGHLYSCGGKDEGTSIACVQVYHQDNWHIYQDNISSLTERRYYYHHALDIDPTDTTHVFVGSNNGLYEFRNGLFTKFYNNTNSPIEPYNGKSNNYQLVTSVTFDNNGTLWLFNSQAPTQSLISLSKDGTFTSHQIPGLMQLDQSGYENKSLGKLSHMRFDDDGNLWFVNNNWFLPGIYRYNLQTKTLKSFTNFINQDYISIENILAATCFTEDRNHDIWVGTNRGPLILENSQFDATNPYFTQFKVPRNDGTNNADYLLYGVNVTSIAIDGGNRKWIGTDGNGVYLISADNTEQIHHFTKENSSLLSNSILSIAINHATGEVYFGTDMGLCSYMANATAPSDEMHEDDVYAYPNPVEPGYTGLITVVGLSFDADVKILTSNGKLVAQGRSNGGTFTWDGCDSKGNRVASGVYMVATAMSNGDKGVVCKIAIVR